MTEDVITFILPKGVRFLLDQAFSTVFISFSLFSKLIVTISSTSVENTTPRTLNVTWFQSRLISGINLNLELFFCFCFYPIHTALVFININIFRPDTEANCYKTDIHEQNDSLVPSRKNVVSSANFDNNISSSRRFISCMFSVWCIIEANSSEKKKKKKKIGR